MSRKSYFEHDNRLFQDSVRNMGRRKFNSRRPTGGFQRYRYHDRDAEGDVEMSAGGSGRGHHSGTDRRFGPYKPSYSKIKKRGYESRMKPVRKQTNEYENSWFKISIPHTRKEGKEFVLKSLQSNCRVPFVPYNFHFDGNASVFFVDNHSSARCLVDVSKRITLQDGFKMSVYMNKSGPPPATIDEEALKQIKLCMNRRYDVVTHTLDLSKFFQDVGLRAEGYFLPLNRPAVFTNVVKVIKEHIPEIETLNVSHNGLYSLQAFSSLSTICANLTKLSLANNRIKTMKDIDNLKGLPLVTLILDGNTLCDDFKDKETYINALRDRFPKLMILDGQELPAPIGFDLGNINLPASKGSYLTDSEEIKMIAVQFLEEYYMLYDSEEKKDREKLLEKYHDIANFSYCVNLSKSTNAKGKNTGLGIYVPGSRNLLRVSDPNYRHKLIKQGRLAVVSALSALPATQHDPNSFMVDVAFVTSKFIQLSVTGVFKEVAIDMLNQPLRTFKRDFLITLHSDKWIIMTDMLTIADATPEQVKAFKAPAPTPSPSPAPSSGDKSPNEKQQLVIEFTKLTGMNLDFSTKCLEENDWDFQKSSLVFHELNSLEKIPREAFITDDRQRLTIEFVKLTGMNIEFSAKCLEENDWDFQKASLVFQEFNSQGRIPPEAFVNKLC